MTIFEVVAVSGGFLVTTSAGVTHALTATEVALAAVHVLGGFGEQLDNRSSCPICREKHERAHGYNGKAKAAGADA